MIASPQFLEQSARSALSNHDIEGAIAFREQLRQLQPSSVENLLHLMLLAMHGDELSLEKFSDLDLIAQLEAAAIQGNEGVDPMLVLQAINKFLEAPFLAMETVQFVLACQPFVPNTDDFVELVFPRATQLGYQRSLYGLAAALTEVCLVAQPENLNLLMQLPLLCQKANIYGRDVSAARQCFELANNDTDRLYASYLLFRGLLNTGGDWDEAVAMIPQHRLRIATLVAASPILSPVDSLRLLPATYFLPYIEDRPEINHRVQNQLIAILEQSMRTHGNLAFDRYQASHTIRQLQPPPQKLKIGYLCHCFHSHSVGWLARWLLQHHDLEQIELYAYMINPVQKADYVQDQYRKIVPNLRECGFEALEIAEQIHLDGIDILVDLDSLTLDVSCEVMALKPAPIQVTWLGWDASGVGSIDYYLADPYVLPDNAQDYYVEEIWRLPTTYLAVDGFEVGEPDLTRLILDIPEDAVVYYSGQRGYKRHRETTLWQLKIIAQVPKGIFLVKGLADEEAVKAFFYELADEVGLERDRLRFAPQADSEEIHRANLAIADIVLDTFPYNGATTTMEALWMERPLVTLVGEQFAARNSYTMLVNAGIEEGIAWSPAEYIEWGVRLGKDAVLRASVVEKLRQSKLSKAPLWNGKQFAQDVEVAYQEMARRFWSEDEGAVQARIDRHTLARQRDIVDPVIAKAVLVLVDWQQSEEDLEQSLYGILDRIIAAPVEHRFFIDTTGTDEETVDLILGGALMNFLMMQEEHEVAQEPNITLIPPLDANSLKLFTSQNFHCAKLLSGNLTLSHNVADSLSLMADYADDLPYQISKIAQLNPSEQCKICGAESLLFGQANMLNKYTVDYFQCSQCRFVQTEQPYWLDEAYEEAIAGSDVGLVNRNLRLADLTQYLLGQYFDADGAFLDYGGGYGLFVRFMRDRGYDFYWHDTFCQNLMAQGFEGLVEQKYELVTAFELVEHLVDPIAEIRAILACNDSLLFSTELLPDSNPAPDVWWYYAPHEGQHISIYTYEALRHIAKQLGVNLYSNGKSVHLLTRRTMPEDLFQMDAEVFVTPRESLLPKDAAQAFAKRKTESAPNTGGAAKSLNVIPERSEQEHKGLLNAEREIEQHSQDISSSSLVNPTLSGKIIVDGAFYQLYNTGIGRLWQSLLEEWAKGPFTNNIVVLDRAGTAPKILGIRYRTLPPCDYENLAAEQDFLQAICDEENACLFISTYYTRPRSTPSVFMGYDMIPEVMEWDMTGPIWRSKHDAIRQAIGHITISQNTADDLHRYFPQIDREKIISILCGVPDHFSPASEAEISHFRDQYNIHKPYFLLVGAGLAYKNAQLFLDGLSQLSIRQGLEVICTGASAQDFTVEAQKHWPGIVFHPLFLEDNEFRSAYSGALALVYPSKYEGFGLPVVEAMKCGCPVITCRNASIPEVAGEAAIYIADSDANAMAEALLEVQKPQVRKQLIKAGYQQAAKFSWATMAQEMQRTLSAYLEQVVTQGSQILVLVDWTQPEAELYEHLLTFFRFVAAATGSQTFLIDTTGTDPELASMVIGGVLMDYLMMEEANLEEEPSIQFIDPVTAESIVDLNLSAQIVLGEISAEIAAMLQGIPVLGN